MNKLKPLIQVDQVSKTYIQGKTPLTVLNEVSLNVIPEEQFLIMGPSGSGKSTLLHLMGGLDRPSQGKILWENLSSDAPESQITQYRKMNMGIVFQFFHLLPDLTALENVMMSLQIKYPKQSKAIHVELAEEALAKVQLSHRMTHMPNQLSGGEQQRVAIARSWVQQPKLILADEPTGNLDYQTGMSILELLMGLCAEKKITLLMVSHNKAFEGFFSHRLYLEDGRVQAYKN